MSRFLRIESKNCMMEKGKASFKINGESLESLIVKNLPEDIKEYSLYQITLNIQIALPENDQLKVIAKGYKLANADSSITRKEGEEVNE